MFNIHAWGWPQWVEVCLLFLGLVIEASLHGREKLDPDKKPWRYNFPVAFCRTALVVFILAMGGFYSHGVL